MTIPVAEPEPEVNYQDLLVDNISLDSALSLGVQLVDRRQRYLAIVKERIAANDGDTLTAFSTGTHAVHKALGLVSPTSRVPGLVSERFKRHEEILVHSGRALASLGLALVAEPSRASDHLAMFRAWMDHAGLRVPSGPVHAIDSRIRPPHREVLEHLIERAELDSLTLAWLLELDGWPHPRQAKPRVRTGPGVQVLLDCGPTGQRAELTLSWARGLPPGLIPDPATMSLTSADNTFQDALTAAWEIAGGPRSHAVLWSLADRSGPVRRVQGPSLGAAFAALLDEMRRVTKPVTGPLTMRRLRATNAIVGAIDRKKPAAILSVSGYEAKLKVVTDSMRVILPRADLAKAVEANRDGFAELKPVDTWHDAAKAGRRLAARRVLGVIASGLSVFLLIAVILTATVFAPRLRESAADELLASANKLRGVDEPRAVILSAAAQRARTRPDTVLATLEALLNNQGTIALLPTDTPARQIGIGAAGRRIFVLEQNERLMVWAIEPAGARIVETAYGVTTMAVSADGRLLATGDRSGHIQLRDASSWSVLQTWQGPDSTGGHTQKVVSLSFDAQGTSLAAATESSERVRLWEISSGEFRDRVLSPKHAPISRLGFTTNGAVVAEMGFDIFKEWTLWDSAKDEVRLIEQRISAKENILIGPNTVIAGCTENGQAELLEPETRLPVPGLPLPPRCMTNPMVMAGTRTLYVDVPTDHYLQPQQPHLMVFDNIGHWVTVRGRQPQPLPNGAVPPPDGPYALSATANVLASYDGGAVRVTRLPRQRQGGESLAVKMQFLRDDTLLVLRENGHLQRVNESGESVATVTLPHTRADFSISPDQSHVAVIGHDANDGQIRLRRFTLPELKPVGQAVVVEPPEAVTTYDVGIATLDDGRLVARVGNHLFTYAAQPHTRPVNLITLAGDGDGLDWRITARPETNQVALATPDGSGVQLIDIDGRTTEATWGPLPGGRTQAVQFNGRDTALALSATSASVIDINANTVEARPLLGELPPESADGPQILTGWPRLLDDWGFEADSNRIWAETPIDGQRFKPHRLLLSPSGEQLAVVRDNFVDIVPTDPAEWGAALCAITSAAHERIRRQTDLSWMFDPC